MTQPQITDGHPLDESDLDDRFTPYYKSGERVEVTYKLPHGGLPTRFYVGRSTGWKPIYIALLNKNSSGGGGILSTAVASVRGLGVYRR